MRNLNTLSMAATSGSSIELQRPISFPEGQKCRSITLRASIPVKNTSGGGKDLTNAEVLGILRAFFAAITMKFGDRAPDVFENATDFDTFRLLHLLATGRDVYVEGGPLIDYSDTATNKLTIGAGATGTLDVVLSRPFIFERFGKHEESFCPGKSQMETLSLEVKRGGAFPTDLEQPSAATIKVRVETTDADGDPWVKPFRIFSMNKDGNSHDAPAEGVLLALCEATKAHASTDLTLFSLKRDGDAPIHDTIDADDVGEENAFLLPIGYEDPASLVTVLFQVKDECDLEGLPSGKFEFVQHATDLSTCKLRWLILPSSTDADADAAGAGVADKSGGLVKLTRDVGPGTSAKLASVAPMLLVKPDSEGYDLRAGFVYGPGAGRIATHFPPAMRAAVEAAIKSQGNDDGARAAAIAQVTRTVSAQVPGATSPKRREARVAMGEVARKLVPPDFHKLIGAGIGRIRASFK